MKSLLLFLSLTLILVACTDQQVIKNKETKSLVKLPIRANSKLTLGVTGMVCKMGCGGAIRKELLATKAVEKVEVDFDENRESQNIIVYYDDQLSSKNTIMAVISSMNDKQFTAKSLAESTYSAKK